MRKNFLKWETTLMEEKTKLWICLTGATRQEWWKQDRNSETPQMLSLLQISQKSKYVDSRTLECNEYLICKSAKSSFVQD